MEPIRCYQAGTCLILHATRNLSQMALPLSRAGFSVSFAQAARELIAAKTAANRRPRYVTSLRYYLAQFSKGRENLPLENFTPAEIEAWLNRYPGAYARQTWLNRLSTLFSFAVRRGYLLANPCVRIERVSVDRPPPLILTPGQAQTALRVIPALARPYFILGLFAGIRPEEIERMDWSQIDLVTKTVRVDGKTRQRRIVPLEPRAVELLNGCVLKRGPVAPAHITLCRVKRKVRNALGLKKWPQDLLRHTAASYLLALHGDAGRVATRLGNSPAVLLTHYHEPVTAADCAEFWAVCPTMSHNVILAGGASASKIKCDGKTHGANQLAVVTGIEGANSGTRPARAAER